jgi:ApbE superfamily uncharacterized protein (UPF0280 family)
VSASPQVRWLADGARLHLNHGPIDLIIQAFGDEAEKQAAYARAVARFDGLLEELVAELPQLRLPARPGTPRAFASPIARRMEAAVLPFSSAFITPMAAVAGSVADEVLGAMLAGGRLERAYVNNGGDIALHLAPGLSLTLAIAGTGHGLDDRVRVNHVSPLRGVATSGWRGRSHSLGIADAVAVLAASSAAADAAATMIANAVDLPGHPAVIRQPACQLAPDSDLDDRPVTVAVGALSGQEIEVALSNGMRVAQDCLQRGLITGAALFLGGIGRVAGEDALLAATPHWMPSHGNALAAQA